jgi:Spy/CpxP family protein refolding chaperone
MLTMCCYSATLLFAVNLAAQAPSTPASTSDQAAAGASSKRHRASIDDRVKQLTKGLDLSEPQQTGVKKILEEQQRQVLRIRDNPSISGETRISQFRALQVDTVERIRGILNEDQKKKYDPLATRKIQQGQQPSVEDWLKATAPQ